VSSGSSLARLPQYDVPSVLQAVAEAEVAALLSIHETVAALADEKRALLTALTAQRVPYTLH